MSYQDFFMVALTNNRLVIQDYSALTATASDVVTGKTFIGSLGTEETGIYHPPPAMAFPVEIIKEVPSKKEKVQKELIKVLLLQKELLRNGE